MFFTLANFREYYIIYSENISKKYVSIWVQVSSKRLSIYVRNIFKKKKKTFLTPYTDRLVSVSWGKKYCFFSENFADMLLNGWSPSEHTRKCNNGDTSSAAKRHHLMSLCWYFIAGWCSFNMLWYSSC